MYNLSDATAKGRINTAGCTKLAVFFLLCLFIFCGCPANASDSQAASLPFVKAGKICSFDTEQPSSKIKTYDFYGVPDNFTQKAVCASKKEGFILAWNSKNQYLYHINSAGNVSSKLKLSGSIVYADKKYILAQTNSFIDNKGFSFTLYSVKYSRANKKISLKKLWDGSIDCFVADCFFTDDGICIGGGTKDDSKHNVFYITANGIHKCFSTTKNSDFLRIMNTGSRVYAFVSGREKVAVEPLIYNFTLDDFAEGTAPGACINLSADTKLPSGFECFFGYGFVMAQNLVLPASIDGIISFIAYDFEKKSISKVINEATGCLAPLGSTSAGYYYLAKDVLLPDSWYGIALFDGNQCLKINAF